MTLPDPVFIVRDLKKQTDRVDKLEKDVKILQDCILEMVRHLSSKMDFQEKAQFEAGVKARLRQIR